MHCGLPLLMSLAIAGPPPLELTEAVRLATQQHPEVIRALATEAHVLSRRVGAQMYLPQNPELSVGLGHRRDNSGSEPAATGLEWAIQLQQMVEVGGQRGRRLREVGWAVTSAHHHVEEARLQAGAAGAEAFVAVQVAAAQMQVAQERATLAERVLHMVQDKEAVGASGGLERTLAQIEMGEAQAGLHRVQVLLHQAEDALRHDLSLGADVDVHLAPLAPPPVPQPPLHDGDLAELRGLVAQAVTRRPAILALTAAAEGFASTTRRLQRETIPNTSLAVDVQHQQPGQLYIGGSVGVALPMLHRNQGALAENAALAAQNAHEQALVLRALQRDVATGRVRQVQCAKVLEAVATVQLPAAQDHAEMTIAAWRAGKLDMSRVVQSLRYLSEARQGHADAVAALWSARIFLHKTLGLLP